MLTKGERHDKPRLVRRKSEKVLIVERSSRQNVDHTIIQACHSGHYDFFPITEAVAPVTAFFMSSKPALGFSSADLPSLPAFATLVS